MSSGARGSGVPSVITFLCVLVIPFFLRIFSMRSAGRLGQRLDKL